MSNIETIRQQTGVKKAYVFAENATKDEIENEIGEDVLKSIFFDIIPYMEEARGQAVVYFSITSGNQTFISVKTPKNMGAIVTDENANIGFLKVIINQALS